MTTPNDPSNNNNSNPEFPQYPQGSNDFNNANGNVGNPNASSFGDYSNAGYPNAGYPNAGYPSAGYQAVPPMQKPDSYLIWAILSTLLCCLPLGIVSIVFSSRVDSAWNAGNFQEAAANSEKAKKFAIYSAVAGVAAAVLYIVFIGGLGVLSTQNL